MAALDLISPATPAAGKVEASKPHSGHGRARTQVQSLLSGRGARPPLLAKGKNDLLAIVQGPEPQRRGLRHQTASTTRVLTIPGALALPMAGGGTRFVKTLDIHKPSVIIGGLDRLGIPVTH